MIQGLYDLQWVAWLLWTCFLTGWREDISYLVGLVEDRGEMVLCHILSRHLGVQTAVSLLRSLAAD